MTPFQERVLAVVQGRGEHNGANSISTLNVSHRLGYRPAARGRLATILALWKLVKMGKIGHLAPRDRWEDHHWYWSKRHD